MLNLNNVMLVCVDGRNDVEKIEKSYKAFKYSASQVEFGAKGFFSPIKPTECPDECWVNIDPLDYKQYSEFMLKKLIDSLRFCNIEDDNITHILTVQDDGFVLDPSAWDDSFLDYDWIGSPWPGNLIIPNEDQSCRVGNGGFSLRSIKGMNLIQKYVPWPNYPAFMFGGIINKGTNGWYNPEWDVYNEDRLVCIWFAQILKDMGFDFAPDKVAVKFGYENIFKGERGLYTKKTFGFHGRHLPQHFENFKLLD